MDDQVQATLEVVEHRQLFRQHQQDVRRVEFVRLVAASESRLDVADALEAEPAHQPAGEAGQAFEFRDRVRGAQRFDFGEGIGDLAAFDDLAVVADFHGMATEGDHPFRGQADDGITAEAFAAFHRLQQVGVRGVGEFQVDRERRVQVGQHFADYGDACVAFSGVALELLGRDQGGLPSGNRGHGGRRQGTTIARAGERKEGAAGASDRTWAYFTPASALRVGLRGRRPPALEAEAPIFLLAAPTSKAASQPFCVERQPFRFDRQPFSLKLEPSRLEHRPFCLECQSFRLELQPFRLGTPIFLPRAPTFRSRSARLFGRAPPSEARAPRL